jgi:hypothetical protein
VSLIAKMAEAIAKSDGSEAMDLIPEGVSVGEYIDSAAAWATEARAATLALADWLEGDEPWDMVTGNIDADIPAGPVLIALAGVLREEADRA